MSCGAENEAKTLIDELLDGIEITIPNIDMSGTSYQFPVTDIRTPIARLTTADLTTGQVGGTGVFDQVMKSVSNHLMDEYNKNRITGAEYTKAYIALVTAAMSSSTSFLLQRDQAYWQAQLSQIQAITARVQLETAKAEYAKIGLEALTAKAQYAVAAMNVAKASNDYCLTKNELEVLRPLQAAGLTQDNTTKSYTNLNILPEQKNNLIAQGDLLKEQAEVQRAQTMETRSDGSPINGSIGKQKALYTQQITSYQRDSEVKVAKIFSDAWITMKTIDEGVLPPDGFANTSLDQILAKLKLNNSLT